MNTAITSTQARLYVYVIMTSFTTTSQSAIVDDLADCDLFVKLVMMT